MNLDAREDGSVFQETAQEISHLLETAVNNPALKLDEQRRVVRALSESLGHSSLWGNVKTEAGIDPKKKTVRETWQGESEAGSSKQDLDFEWRKLIDIRTVLVDVLENKAEVKVGKHVPKGTTLPGIPYIEIIFSSKNIEASAADIPPQPTLELKSSYSSLDELIQDLKSFGDRANGFDSRGQSTTTFIQAEILDSARKHLPLIFATNKEMKVRDFLKIGGLNNEQITSLALPFFEKMKSDL
jgi:hypothetical protein